MSCSWGASCRGRHDRKSSQQYVRKKVSVKKLLADSCLTKKFMFLKQIFAREAAKNF